MQDIQRSYREQKETILLRINECTDQLSQASSNDAYKKAMNEIFSLVEDMSGMSDAELCAYDRERRASEAKSHYDVVAGIVKHVYANQIHEYMTASHRLRLARLKRSANAKLFANTRTMYEQEFRMDKRRRRQRHQRHTQLRQQRDNNSACNSKRTYVYVRE